MLTQARLKELFFYDPACGDFVRIKRTTNSVCIGDIAGTLNFHGYIQTSVNCKIYKNHRLAWLYVYGEFPSEDLDHINRIKTDNRILNLRRVTDSQNLQNVGLRSDNKSGYKGVCWDVKKEKWSVRMTYNNKYRHLGCFDDVHEAGSAYIEASKKHHSHGIYKNG
jgi:hypothetical protein